jgi:hypothetical protein
VPDDDDAELAFAPHIGHLPSAVAFWTPGQCEHASAEAFIASPLDLLLALSLPPSL